MLTSGVLILLTIIGVAVGAVSITIGRTELFRPVRMAVRARSTFLGKLLNCPYCLAHWFALTGMAVFQPVLVSAYPLASLFLGLFFVVAVAAVAGGLISFAMMAYAAGDPPVTYPLKSNDSRDGWPDLKGTNSRGSQ